MKTAAACVLVWASLLAMPAAAHEQPMAYIGIEAAGAHTLQVLTKDARRGERTLPPLQLSLRPACVQRGQAEVTVTEEALIRRWQLQCSAAMEAHRLHIDGLNSVRPEALVHIRVGAASRYQRATRDAPEVALTPTDRNATPSVATYFLLGIEHILAGPDHLLFVLGLVLVLWRAGRGVGAWIGTVTAFTLAHSITLSLATLGALRLPPAPVEAVIALSILLLAVELARAGPPGPGREAPPSWTFRFPWAVAFGFGLLHGFGFAGALADIGLPPAAEAWALASFNLGVEAGQLLFIAALLLLRPLGRWLPTAPTAQLATHALGGIACYWLLVRVTTLGAA
ncbi:HupE/UreJ family protein [Algiphilus sp.]|uniref:HupE/UreJ family protein n=1 Tax=Algiphilus sp. TaxID=1872431 RepID=UPI0032EFAE80